MNIQQLMKQAQQMQAKMQEMQDKLAQMEVDGKSGGGLVNVVVNGKGDVLSVKIDPSLLKPEEGDMLEDLILAAINDGRGKANTLMEEEMKKVTGGMGMPSGMKLPF